MSTQQLSTYASHTLVDEVTRTGTPTIVTRDGVPVVVMIPIDEVQLEDMVLARAPMYVADMDAATEDLAAGLTRSAIDIFGELTPA